jgi:SAM-dependent methyltransferase
MLAPRQLRLEVAGLLCTLRPVLPPLTLAGALRYDVLRRILRQLDGVHSVLEIGVGVGGVAARLSRGYRYTGLDLDPDSAAIARSRVTAAGNNGVVIHGTTADLEHGSVFDLVCAFEVLEHIEDDECTLREWLTFVRPGGWLLLSVPARHGRLGPHDEAAGHIRRYTRGGLTQLAEQVGLSVERVIGYGFPLGNALEAVWHLAASRSSRQGTLQERTAHSGRRFQPPAIVGAATQALTLPFAVAQRATANTDLGVGLILLGRRPPDQAGRQNGDT